MLLFIDTSDDQKNNDNNRDNEKNTETHANLKYSFHYRAGTCKKRNKYPDEQCKKIFEKFGHSFPISYKITAASRSSRP